MISTPRLAPPALLVLILVLGACSPSATTPPAPSASAGSDIAFHGTVQAAVETLTTQGFTCDPEPTGPMPTNGTAADKVYSRICGDAPQDGPVTRLYLYALRSDKSLAGLSVFISGRPSDPAWTQAVSQKLTSVIALFFPAPAAAIIQTAITGSTVGDGSGKGDGQPHVVSPFVRVINLSEGVTNLSMGGNTLVEIWGPEVSLATPTN